MTEALVSFVVAVVVFAVVIVTDVVIVMLLHGQRTDCGKLLIKRAVCHILTFLSTS